MHIVHPGVRREPQLVVSQIEQVWSAFVHELVESHTLSPVKTSVKLILSGICRRIAVAGVLHKQYGSV